MSLSVVLHLDCADAAHPCTQIAWNRACPALRTVQLHPGWVWRRADPADCWAARPSEWGVWGNVFGIGDRDETGEDEWQQKGENQIERDVAFRLKVRRGAGTTSSVTLVAA